MSVFLSSYTNKVDKKGRVSVPAPFRGVLAKHSSESTATGLVVFRSLQFSALEACSPEHMEKLAADLEQMDISAEERDLIETTLFADSVQLPIDPDGRILLPKDLLDHAGIGEEARFVGRGKIFQIWEPKAFDARSAEVRALGAASGISLSSITTLARRPAPAASPAKE
jgi:MraZ protein